MRVLFLYRIRPLVDQRRLHSHPYMGTHRTMDSQHLLVADHQFILATRDTGYRGLASAVAELIDNAVQARASEIRIFVREDTTASLLPEMNVRQMKKCNRHLRSNLKPNGHASSPRIVNGFYL